MTPHRYSTVAHLRVKLWITKQTSIIHAIAAPQPSLERDVMFNYTAEPPCKYDLPGYVLLIYAGQPQKIVKYCSNMDVAGSADYFELKQQQYTAERPMPICRHNRLRHIPSI